MLLGACASYTGKTKQGLDAFSRRDYAAADTIYTTGADKEGVDPNRKGARQYRGKR